MTTVRRVDLVNDDRAQGSMVRGAEMDQRVRTYMAKHGEKSYSIALAAVAKSHRELATEYAKVDREAHRGDSFDPKFRSRMEREDSSSGLPRESVPSQAEMQIDRGEAGQTVNERVLQMCRENSSLSYEEALLLVLNDDPELAQRYRGMFKGDGDFQFKPFFGGNQSGA